MDEGVHTLHALKFLLLPLGMIVIWLCWKRLQRAGNCGCVLVLGDFGRSPRMQYHTISLSQHLEHVDVLAYLGSDNTRGFDTHTILDEDRLQEHVLFLLFFYYSNTPSS